MAITSLPLEYLSAVKGVDITSAQERMESGSDVFVTTIGYDPLIEKHSLRYVGPPEYVASLYQLFCVQDHLVGIYSVTDPIAGVSYWQPEGGFTYSPTGMKRWAATITMRRV